MKAVLIVHNEAIDMEINEALESVGVNCYTKFTKTTGKGQLSEPRLQSDVWPGSNCGTLVVVDHQKASQIMQKVRAMREKLGRLGLKAFMWEIEDVT